jgi:hypothetical protein
LHYDALALVQPLAAGQNLALWQKGGPVPADIDERRPVGRDQLAHPPQMNAPGLIAIAALDEEFDGHALFEQRSAPFAGTRRYQQLASQLGLYPWPASSWVVSKSGSPTTFE